MENRHTWQTRPLTSDDIPAIASIHQTELPDDFCAILGDRFLSALLYPGLLKVSDVALGTEQKGKLIAYVLFSQDEGFFSSLVFGNFWSFLSFVIPNLLKWRFLKYLLEVVLLVFKKDDRLKGHELAYIAVHKAYAGQGIGSELVRQSLAQLREKGFEHAWVKTLASTPENIRFYEKAGFEVLKTYLGRTYLTIRLH